MIPSSWERLLQRDCPIPEDSRGYPPGLLAPYALAHLKVLNRTGAGQPSMRSACCWHLSVTDGDCPAPSSTAAAPPVPGAQLFISPAESWERQPQRDRSPSQGLYRGQPGVSTPDSPTFRWGLHDVSILAVHGVTAKLMVEGLPLPFVPRMGWLPPPLEGATLAN